MSKVVIDTNVAVVANRRAPQASPKCVVACVNALAYARDKSVIVLDRNDRILQEYMHHASLSGQPGVGDAFFKWLWQNQSNVKHCFKVDIHEQNDVSEDYSEFPSDSRLQDFDRSDRKFVAVSVACRDHPPILNAVDSDWWNYRNVLAENGVTITFLCPGQFDTALIERLVDTNDR